VIVVVDQLGRPTQKFASNLDHRRQANFGVVAEAKR
jgi:hypothetical protein